MEQGKTSLDAETGTVMVVRESRSRGCFWQALCALALLVLVALTTFTILSQRKALPTDGDAAQGTGTAAVSFQTNNDLERIVKEVGNAKRSNIAAHVTASGIIKGKEVVWQDETDSTLTEGVDLENNGLVIRTTGQYFVYGQVVFHGRGCQEKATYLSHNISSLSASYPEESLLLKAIKSVCHYGPHGEPWYKTSYQGAIFQFLEGDQIYSRVAEGAVNFVDTAHGKTFFGIFAL
ncbi:lymphotoxin-alpha-like [Rhinoraja longicauda]